MALVPMGWLSDSQGRHKGQDRNISQKEGKGRKSLFLKTSTEVWDSLPCLWFALVDLFPVVHLALHYQSDLGQLDLQLPGFPGDSMIPFTSTEV